MSQNKGEGKGKGATKSVSPEQHATNRELAKARKAKKGHGKNMHAATFTDSKSENAAIMAANALDATVEAQADALDLVIAAIEERAMQHRPAKPGEEAKRRFADSTLEAMRHYAYFLFENTEENKAALEAHPINNYPRREVEQLFVFACELHFLRSVYQRQYNWYKETSQLQRIRLEVGRRRYDAQRAQAAPAA